MRNLLLESHLHLHVCSWRPIPLRWRAWFARHFQGLVGCDIHLMRMLSGIQDRKADGVLDFDEFSSAVLSGSSIMQKGTRSTELPKEHLPWIWEQVGGLALALSYFVFA